MTQQVSEKSSEKLGDEIAKRYTRPLVSRKLKPECVYPKCNRVAVTKIHGILLCQEHVDLAEFIKWFHYRLGLS